MSILKEKIWNLENFDEVFKIGMKYKIKNVLKEFQFGYLIEIEGGLKGILFKRSIPDSILNFKVYIKTNESYVKIINIDKSHKKVSFEYIIEENDDIEAIEFDSNDNILYIDINFNDKNQTISKFIGDIKAIKKRYSDFFKDYDSFEYMDNEEIFNIVFSQMFAIGSIKREIFFSNSSLGNDLKLTIRMRNTINNIFPKDTTLLIKGFLDRRDTSPVFVPQRATLSSDYDKKRFEIVRECFVKYNPDEVNNERKNNILSQEFINALPPQSKIAKKRLSDWQDFLNWSEKYATKNMEGFVYLKVEEENKNLVFYGVCESDKVKRFERLAKNGELAIYEKSISTKKYIFDYNLENRFNKLFKVGDFVDLNIKEIKDEKTLLEFEKFDNPVGIEISFEIDGIEEYSDEDEDKIKEVIEKELNRIPNQGFIATNSIGTLSQINRQKRTLRDVISGDVYAPFLSSWLFDIKNADTPKEIIPISNYFNKNLNEDQKEAVNKMFNVPNIGLLQGPPGTGKTTVISELIYQFISQGKKILLSSQSNLAVDNVLERLAINPNIRAIRLGKAGKVSDEAKKFLEENIVDSFYKNIAQTCEDKFIKNKIQTKQTINDLEKIKAKYEILNQKKDNFSKEIQRLKNNILNIDTELQMLLLQKEEIETKNKENLIYKKQLNKLLKSLDNNEDFYLQKFDVFRILEELESQGIYLGIKALFSDKSLDEKNEVAIKIIQKLKKIPLLISQLSKEENSHNYDNEEIKKEILRLRNIADEIDDEDEWMKIQKEIRKLKKSIKNETLNPIYLEMLTSELYEKIRNNKEILKTLNFEFDIEKFKNKILKEIKNIEIIPFDDRNIKILNTKKLTLKEEIKTKRNSISEIDKKIKELKKILSTFRIDSFDDIDKEINNLSYHLKHFVSDELKDVLEGYVERLRDEDILIQNRDKLLQTYIENANVVAMTLNENRKSLENKGFFQFDVAIVDEVSKATPPELLTIMSISKKVILVGDHRQLPPIFNFNEERAFKEVLEGEMEDSNLTKKNYKRFEKMVSASLFKEYFEQADKSIKTSLLTQYRMHTDIMNLINHFYEGKLIQGLKNPDKDRNHNINILTPLKIVTPKKHAVWLDTTFKNGKFNKEQKDGVSRVNEYEVEVIKEFLEKLNKEMLELGFDETHRKEVGIISFYGKQVSKLKREIGFFKQLQKKYKALKIEINTVDKYQGKEKDIIIVSMVRNQKINKEYKKISDRVSFVAQFERINVAFSRAKELLVIVGATQMFSDYEVKLPKMDEDGYIVKKVYQNIIEEISSKGCLYDAKYILGGKQ